MSIRVFLVEDVQHMRGVLHDLLNEVGSFEIVATRANEAEANLWIEEHPAGFDLAIVDLILEQGTGMGVIPRAKRIAPSATVVVFSDYATPGIQQHCIKLGASAVFQKSSDMRAFMEYCAALGDRAEASA